MKAWPSEEQPLLWKDLRSRPRPDEVADSMTWLKRTGQEKLGVVDIGGGGGDGPKFGTNQA